MSVPLVLEGDLSIEGIGVSDDVVAFTVNVSSEQVTVPATMGRRFQTVRSGARSGTITIEFLNSESATSVQQMFIDAFYDAESIQGADELEFRGKVRDDSQKAWTGTFVVTDISDGGGAWTIGQQSVTFPLVELPVSAPVGS